MFFKYAVFKVLKVFFEHPFESFYLRKVAKMAKVSTATAKTCLDFLFENKFLKKEKIGNLLLFKADYEPQVFRRFKMAFNVLSLESSGLADFLKENISATSVVVYGSFARGEDDEKSDIDILVIAYEKKVLDLSGFEKKLKRKIKLLYYNPNQWKEKAKTDKPFYDRILLDGIALYGNPPVV